MICSNQHAILPCHVFCRQFLAGHSQMWVVSREWKGWNVRIIVGDVRTLLEKQVHELETGRFTGIVHVPLGHSENCNVASLYRLGPVVKCIGYFANDKAR